MTQQLTNTQRQFLRRIAHDLKPVVQIGKNGLTDQVEITLNQALEAQELIKVKFVDFQDQKHELAEQMAGQTHSILISVIGNVAILYREQRDLTRRKITLP